MENKNAAGRNIGDKINKVFTNIQSLQIQPTENNVMLMADSMMTLKEIYRDAVEMIGKLPNEDGSEKNAVGTEGNPFIIDLDNDEITDGQQ